MKSRQVIEMNKLNTLKSLALALTMALACAGQQLVDDDELIYAGEMSTPSLAIGSNGEINGLIDIESQNAIIPNDEEECGNLEDNGVLFCDFCLASRDHIVGELRHSLSQAVSNVFALFFNVFEKLNIDAAKVKQIEAEQEAEDKKRMEAQQVPGQHEQQQQVNTQVRQASDKDSKKQSAIDVSGGPVQFLLKLLRGLADKFAGFVINKIEQLQRRFGLDKLKFATGGACAMLETFDQHISNEFIKIRDEIAMHAFDFKYLKMKDIKCITIRRLVRLKGICGVISRFTDPLRFLSRSFVNLGRQ